MLRARSRYASLLEFFFVIFVLTVPAQAHFQVLFPTSDIVTDRNDMTIDFNIVFTHPMEHGPTMNMGKPLQFGAISNGVKHDLRDSLKPVEIDGKRAYTSSFKIDQPADYIFFLETAPYWEPAEGILIIQYTKVVVDAFSAEEGWDELVGFPVEIQPLVRPYGLWTGNLFRGIVLKNGQPVPFAKVEVEFYNKDRQVSIPSDPFANQVIKADGQGVFSYAIPRSGWWGFVAVMEGDHKMHNPEGKPVDVELGALMWVHVTDMK